MKRITFYQWAINNNACEAGLKYLKGKPANVATWVRSNGHWRAWVCQRLYVPRCADDEWTCHCCGNEANAGMRRRLNEPLQYGALIHHFQATVLPALRKAGVR